MTVNSDIDTGGSTMVQANQAWGVASGMSWSIFVKVMLDDHIDFQFMDNNNNLKSSRVRVYKNGGTPIIPTSSEGGDTGNGGSSVEGAYQLNTGLNTTVGGTGWGAGQLEKDVNKG